MTKTIDTLDIQKLKKAQELLDREEVISDNEPWTWDSDGQLVPIKELKKADLKKLLNCIN